MLIYFKSLVFNLNNITEVMETSSRQDPGKTTLNFTVKDVKVI
jgi:hypothetical protein